MKDAYHGLRGFADYTEHGSAVPRIRVIDVIPCNPRYRFSRVAGQSCLTLAHPAYARIGAHPLVGRRPRATYAATIASDSPANRSKSLENGCQSPAAETVHDTLATASAINTEVLFMRIHRNRSESLQLFGGRSVCSSCRRCMACIAFRES